VVLIPVFLVLTVITSWCFYIKFMRSHLRLRRVRFLEVQDSSTSPAISRRQAKLNLNLAVQAINEKKLTNDFDRVWYK